MRENNFRNLSLLLIFLFSTSLVICGIVKDFNDQEWNNVLQGLSLVATIWFTWQLVDNDNKRRHDSDHERKIERLANFMVNREGSIAPGINIPYSAADLIDSLGNSEEIVLEAYEHLFYMTGLRITKPNEFKQQLESARNELKAIKKAQRERENEKKP